MSTYKNVFKRHYEDLRKKRSEVTNQELGDTYTNVIDEYNHCLEIEEYVVSFLLIQNLLEDRLYTLYRLYDTQKKKEDGYGLELSLEYYHESIDLKRIVYELHDNGLLTTELKYNLITSITIRNRHIHFSFMNIDSYDRELSDSFYELFREVDKIVQKYKKILKDT